LVGALRPHSRATQTARLVEKRKAIDAAAGKAAPARAAGKRSAA